MCVLNHGSHIPIDEKGSHDLIQNYDNDYYKHEDCFLSSFAHTAKFCVKFIPTTPSCYTGYRKKLIHTVLDRYLRKGMNIARSICN